MVWRVRQSARRPENPPLARSGWKPAIAFADGLKETIRWYLDNQPWVNTIRSGDYLKYYEKQYGSRLAS